MKSEKVPARKNKKIRRMRDYELMEVMTVLRSRGQIASRHYQNLLATVTARGFFEFDLDQVTQKEG